MFSDTAIDVVDGAGIRDAGRPVEVVHQLKPGQQSLRWSGERLREGVLPYVHGMELLYAFGPVDLLTVWSFVW